jgi:hypothetical protein
MTKNIVIGVLILIAIGVSIFLVLTYLEMDELKNELALTKFELSATEVKLSASESELEAKKLELSDTQQQLDGVTSELEITEGKLRMTETKLESTESQLALEKSRNNQMVSDYGILKDSIDSRVILSKDDKSAMITPDNGILCMMDLQTSVN